MIKVNGISKSFADKQILKNVDFSYSYGDKIGLVGRNGSGKSTFFKVLLGEESYDDGEIHISKNYKVGALRQHISFSEKTVIDECALSLSEDEKYNHYKLEKLLFGLGFSKEDMQKDPYSFSGGYQIRINLVKLLATNPNLLLLDEPTNYLDIVSMRWLGSFLKNFDGEVVLITHDSEFMDKVCNKVMGIKRKELHIVSGDTSKFYKKMEDEDVLHEKRRINQQKKVEELEDFIARNRARASTAALAQGKIKELEKMDILEALESDHSLSFSFNYKDTHTKVFGEAKNISFAYDNSDDLFNNLSFTIKKGKCLAIIGKNGKGKSTLLNYLYKKSTGVSYHDSIKIAYFGQTNIETLDPKNSVIDEIQSSDKTLAHSRVRSICGNMMFSADDAKKSIGVLSGGEKSRVTLGKIIATPANLLFLDEPTNHLDMYSIEALQDAIKKFDGSVVLVSHSEKMLHALADELVVFQDGNASHYDCNYEEFLSKHGFSEEENTDEEPIVKKQSTLSNKEIQVKKKELKEYNKKTILPLKRDLEKLENEIISLEDLVEKKNEELVELATNLNTSELQKVSKEVDTLNTKIEFLYDKMEIDSEKLDILIQEYEEKLEKLTK